MSAPKHYFTLLSFKGQKLENRLNAYESRCQYESTTENFFDDLICYFDNPELISVNEFYEYDINTLLPYLKVCHEEYLKTQIPVILSSLAEAIKLNSENESFADKAPIVFSKFFTNLENHIALEEEKLYPYASALENNEYFVNLNYSTTQFAIDHKENELKISSLIDYVAQFESAFVSNFAFNQLQKQLNEFKLDLDLHELLEDEVLIPKLVELELRLGLRE